MAWLFTVYTSKCLETRDTGRHSLKKHQFFQGFSSSKNTLTPCIYQALFLDTPLSEPTLRQCHKTSLVFSQRSIRFCEWQIGAVPILKGLLLKKEVLWAFCEGVLSSDQKAFPKCHRALFPIKLTQGLFLDAAVSELMPRPCHKTSLVFSQKSIRFCEW